MKEHKYVNFNQEAVFALIEKNLKFKKIEK